MISKRISCIVYLEGIKVNFNSIQITESMEGPPSAVVSFPAESAALTALPKTIIHVFYRDAWDPTSMDVLIFMGELSAAGISFSGDKRSINLTFLGIGNNFNTNILIPIDVKINTMLDRALYCQITPNLGGGPKNKTTEESTAPVTTDPTTAVSNILAAGSLGSLTTANSSQAFRMVSTPAPTSTTTTKKLKYPSALDIPWDDIKGFIAYHESSNGALKININNDAGKSHDSGLYQINDIHLKPVNKKELMRIDIDKVFDAFNIGANAPLDSKRSALIDNDALCEAVAKVIYKYKGIRAWSSRYKVLKDYLDAHKETLSESIKIQLNTIILAGPDIPKLTNTTVINFMNFSGLGILDGLLDKIATNDLSTVLGMLFTTFTTAYPGVYWGMLSKAFQIQNMIQIDSHSGIKEIEKLFRVTAVLEHLKKLTQGVPANQPISNILMTILSAIGFEFSEIAAPTYTNGKRIHIMVKPQTRFFPPVKHNLVVDDNIAQLNFSRSFDSEPTRLVGETPPFYLTNDDGLTKAILAVVVPQNVMLNEGVKTNIETKEDYDAIKMFGLNLEEQCRGAVVSRYQDTTGLEEAYLLATKPTDEDTTKDEDKKQKAASAAFKNGSYFTTLLRGDGTSEQISGVQAYHMNVASTQFYNRRHSARTVQVNTPYSPYRLVGFPGVIISKYLPVGTPGIVGTVASISSAISADGNASQTVVFTHCRLLDESPALKSSLGFMDDAPARAIPWYTGYVEQGTLDDFYAQFTGVKDSAVIDPAITGAEGESITSAVMKIKEEMNQVLASGSTQTLEEYLLRKTYRPLVTKNIIDAVYPSSDFEVRTLQDTPKVSYNPDEIYPYVFERRDRVLKAFNTVA